MAIMVMGVAEPIYAVQMLLLVKQKQSVYSLLNPVHTQSGHHSIPTVTMR